MRSSYLVAILCLVACDENVSHRRTQKPVLEVQKAQPAPLESEQGGPSDSWVEDPTRTTGKDGEAFSVLNAMNYADAKIWRGHGRTPETEGAPYGSSILTSDPSAHLTTDTVLFDVEETDSQFFIISKIQISCDGIHLHLDSSGCQETSRTPVGKFEPGMQEIMMMDMMKKAHEKRK